MIFLVMYIMNDTPAPNEEEQLQALIERMDMLLANGAKAKTRMDELYREHGIVPGMGEEMLRSDAVSERDREIFRRLIAEYEHMEHRLRSFEDQAGSSAPRSVGVRAVGNRYRI